MHMVLTGSLGNISKPLAQILLHKGHQVTVISSQAKRQSEIEALGAQAAIGSVDNLDFLKASFENADAVYCMIPPQASGPAPLEHYTHIGQHYAAALRHTPVRHVVHLSSWGAHLDRGTGFILGSHRVEGILNQLNLAITHLRPGYFYTNLRAFTEMIQTTGRIASNYGGADKIALAHPLDIAAVAAEVLENPATGQQVRYIASDDRTANEIAQALGQALGKPDLSWLTLSDQEVQSHLEARGMLPQMAACARITIYTHL